MLLDAAGTDLTFDEARQAVMATNVFTTHTPVPAGIDIFPPDLMLKYFRAMIPSLKLDEEGFLALGREDVTNKKQGFSMAVLAIRLADHINGVSELHGDVSRHMWHNLWPQVPPDEVPIKHVTNGIHVRTWLSPDIAFTLDRYLPRQVDDQARRLERLGRRRRRFPTKSSGAPTSAAASAWSAGPASSCASSSPSAAPATTS